MKSIDILLSLDGVELEVSKTIDGHISVNYKDAEVKDNLFLVFDPGRGKTLEEACDDYLTKIRGKKLVFNAYTNDRREVVVLG